ncbi:MAG: hypothetical protein JKY27_14265, partial [Magnetovibrio sp.]|nr:hypothetical protein [Magnetovibrio sp.]
MRTRLAIKFHGLLERHFPERRLFLKSDTDTRFIRLRPETQLMAYLGTSLVVAWAILSTAVLLMDSIGSGNFREQAKRDLTTYQDRLNTMSTQRDERAAEALAAQLRFNAALAQISVMQSELLASETRRRELETGIDVVQTTLRDTMKDREVARDALANLQAQNEDEKAILAAASVAPTTMSFMTDALADTAAERDMIEADALAALDQSAELEREIRLMIDQNDQIFRQLEEAMAISVEPLNKMFRKAGMPTDQIIEQVRRGYSGQGGPLTPLTFSTRGEDPSPDTLRANKLLDQMDTLNLYRIAAQKAPFASPFKTIIRN